MERETQLDKLGKAESRQISIMLELKIDFPIQ